MSNEEIFAATAIKTWTTVNSRLEKMFSSLSDDELQSEIAPGRNRVYYILGHLAAHHDLLLPVLGIGERLHPELDEFFIKNPDRTFKDKFTGAELRQMFTEVNATVTSGMETMSPADLLKRHGLVSEEDFAKEPLRNRLALFEIRAAHAMYHTGQIRLVEIALSKRSNQMIVVTGATGQLGRLVIANLLKRVPANQIVAAARTPSKAADLAALGVQVREADYGKPATLAKAFAGATSLLLISSPPTPAQDAEHKAVIDAAKTAGVRLLAYTSVLRADTSTLLVAPHHLATEQYLAASGIPWVFLRHPSYIENYTASLASALEYGSIAGSAGDGRNSAATRADLAEAAAVVLTTPGRAGKIYELGSDVAFTMAEFAAEVSKRSGKRVVYNNMPQQDYRALLESVGVPATFANLAADSDVKAASRGELYTGSRDLSGLIGHPTTTMDAAIAAALPR